MLELLPNSDHVHDLLYLLSQKKTAHLTPWYNEGGS